MNNRQIVLKKIKVHNLKEVDLCLDKNKLIVFTGVSGSGKSSLAFDTIYVEGQRRYIESLPHGAKRYLGELKKPQAEMISGLSPTIAIEQKSSMRNPRSTIGTITGIYDYMRVLFARIGIFHCPISNEPVQAQSREKIISKLQNLKDNKKIIILAPYAKNKKGSFKESFLEILKQGFMRVRVDGKIEDLSEISELDPKTAHDVDIVIDRLTTSKENQPRLKEAIDTALNIGKGYFSVLDVDSQNEEFISQYAYSHKSKKSYGPLEPSNFSFNHPSGMCPECQGLGEIKTFDLDKIINPKLSIKDNCCLIASHYETIRYGNIYDNLAEMYNFDVNTKWEKLSQKAKNVYLYGTDKKWTLMNFYHPRKKFSWEEYVQWKGVIHEAKKRLQEAKSEIYRNKIEQLMTESVCPLCHGSKLQNYPAATTVNDKKIHEISAMTAQEALFFFKNIFLSEEDSLIAKDLITEIKKRIQFLLDVGLHYITLDRSSPSLSGGEAQRVKLASQIGCGLIGTTYILDEPSIGLHPSDHLKLINTLKSLRDNGNTIIVVEHDRDTMQNADMIVDIGPKAGIHGGEIIAAGTLEDIKKNKNSLTGQYLTKQFEIVSPKKTRKASKNKSFKLLGASHNNLRNVDLEIFTNVITCITGVSGSGKSSLISDTLYPALSNQLLKTDKKTGKYDKLINKLIDKVIFVDQSPIGRTPRSNPSTYTKLLDEIRTLLSSLKESKIRGYLPGHFSFNVKEGSCSYCKGMGQIKIDMDFLEDEYATCPQCGGKKYDHEILSIYYKDKNIYDILEMSVEEAFLFFENIPSLRKKLQVLSDVGLGYIHLGQPATTLSGGEAQRIKLAKELMRPDTGKTLYILDEPTTGLHPYDIQHLINLLNKLVDKNNSVLVIEHNLDFIKCADWIIDLGPFAGDCGGKIIAQNSPELFIKEDTLTAKFLKKEFSNHQEKTVKTTPPIIQDKYIEIKNAHQNNLKNIFTEIPLNKISVFTGPSGSGKSSLAFDTIYSEGQRRYIDALPVYVRQFVKQMPKSQVENINNLSPCIAIEQKGHLQNPRSTVGTMTEIYDLLRILFSHMGQAYCPETHEKIKPISKDYVVEKILSYPEGEKIYVLSPITFYKSETFEDLKERLKRQGYLRIRLNDKYYELEEEIPFDIKRKNDLFLVIDRLITNSKIKNRLYEAVQTAATFSNNKIVIAKEQEDVFFNLSFAVESTGKSYPTITPQTFSFNSEKGMCTECQGIGSIYGSKLSDDNDFLSLSIEEICYFIFKDYKNRSFKLLSKYFSKLKINTKKELADLTDKEKTVFFNGSDKKIKIDNLYFQWQGLNTILSFAAKHAKAFYRLPLIHLMDERTCPYCEGTRLNPLARNVKINNYSIDDICNMEISNVKEIITSIDISQYEKYLEETIKQITQRLSFLCEIGLGYLSLNRSSPSLSGGELQRIRLARQLGTDLSSCIYVLDEPTIGLHPYNTDLLIKALKRLNNLDNTLILVEHEKMIIEASDYIFDFGPFAGEKGGTITAKGTVKEIIENPNSLTGQYLSNKKTIPSPEKTRKLKFDISIKNASLHNLKNLSVKLPTSAITCITGVSGSGKSTLAHDILKNASEKAIKTRVNNIKLDHAQIDGLKTIEKIISIDQSPIGQTIRADVSTYTEIHPILRHYYASLQSAKIKGLLPRHFSYNHRKGMCKTCYGLGYRNVNLQFLPPVKVKCESCNGQKLNSISLDIKFKGKNIAEVLEMTVSQAIEFFEFIPKILKKLKTIESVGLEYLKLGQEISTLSGGEAQRIRLSKELSKRSLKNTLYIFDEPTIGLHNCDIEKLLSIFHRLADKGNTLIIIEHNLDIIKNADYIIDLGPDAGNKGGEIIAKGTPDEIIKIKNSHTAKYLNKIISSKENRFL